MRETKRRAKRARLRSLGATRRGIECITRSDSSFRPSLKGLIYGVSSLSSDTSVRSVAADGFDTISNVLPPCDSLRSLQLQRPRLR